MRVNSPKCCIVHMSVESAPSSPYRHRRRSCRDAASPRNLPRAYNGRRALAQCWPEGRYQNSENMPQLYASAGIYPHNTHEADEIALAKLDNLLAEPEVIACGEIGLDYYHQGSPHETQKRVFIRQMEIAAARKRPILIHCRPKDGDNTCWDDTLALLSRTLGPTGLGGILHCFSGDWEHASGPWTWDF
jgi:Tat protein secretion system quality control protein TatD with DNase activity